MNKKEFQKEIANNVKTISQIQTIKIINILTNEIPSTCYEKILCQIQNENGTLKTDKQKIIQTESEIKKLYEQVNNGEICFRCYSYPNGSYSYYEEDYDYHYYSNEEIDEVLDKTYEFGRTLIYHKEYSKAIEMFDLILFTNYLCEEVGNPEYDNQDEVLDTFEVDIEELRESLDFDLDYVCLYGIYATLDGNYPNKCEKVHQYLKKCQSHKLEAAFDLGIEPIKNIENFKEEWKNYLKQI